MYFSNTDGFFFKGIDYADANLISRERFEDFGISFDDKLTVLFYKNKRHYSVKVIDDFGKTVIKKVTLELDRSSKVSFINCSTKSKLFYIILKNGRLLIFDLHTGKSVKRN